MLHYLKSTLLAAGVLTGTTLLSSDSAEAAVIRAGAVKGPRHTAAGVAVTTPRGTYRAGTVTHHHAPAPHAVYGAAVVRPAPVAPPSAVVRGGFVYRRY